MDGALAQFGIGGVGHLAGALERHAQSALGGQGQAIAGGLAVDEEAAAFGRKVGRYGAGGVALLAANKQQSNPKSHGTKCFGGRNLGGEDALGVADAAAVHKLRILAERNVGRNGVHVRGKDQIGSLAGHACVDVPARAAGGALGRLLYGGLLDFPAAAGEETDEKVAYRALVVGGGFDFAQLAGKTYGVDRISGQRIEHDAARIPYRVLRPLDFSRLASLLHQRALREHSTVTMQG